MSVIIPETFEQALQDSADAFCALATLNELGDAQSFLERSSAIRMKTPHQRNVFANISATPLEEAAENSTLGYK